MSSHSTGGRDPLDGEMYDASFGCDDCGLYLSWPVTEVTGQVLPAAQDPSAAPMLELIREHDNGGCQADAHLYPAALADSRLVDFPRDLYLKAEDYKARRQQLPQQQLDRIINSRFARFRYVNAKIEQLGAAVKSLKAFDRTGDASAALPHLAALHEDLRKLIFNLADDIREAEARYREASAPAGDDSPPTDSAVAVEPSPKAPAAVDQTAPSVVKPGPHLVGRRIDAGSGLPGAGMASVQIFNPAVSPAAQLARFDLVALEARRRAVGF